MPSASPPPSIATIGTFDGVHHGHQALLARSREIAPPSARILALVFDPSPIEVLRPSQAPPRLTTFEQKRELLLAAGAHDAVRLEPTAALLRQTPEEFLAAIKRDHHVVGIVEGPDFRFGKGRAGDTRTLHALGPSLGFTVHIVEPVTVALTDHTVAPARSTMVRWLLAHGRVSDAARVLGHPYTLRGTVVRGDRRGRTIGYPTANINTPCMSPADGVYAGLARLPAPDGRTFPAAISIGTKSTFGHHQQTMEAVFLNSPSQREGAVGRVVFSSFSSSSPALSKSSIPWSPLPNLPEYGWTLDLEFTAWVREQLRFDSLEPLLAQMDRDCARILEITSHMPTAHAPLEALA